jgi:hypothetical protein
MIWQYVEDEIIGATTIGRKEVRCKYRRGGAEVAIS